MPNDEINKVLKLSYDGLNTLEKKIFLHIACLFKGRVRHHVTRILDALGFEAVCGITVLIEKSLLSISYDRSLHMHDLIQEMGRCIVRECYPYTMVRGAKEFKEVTTTINRLEAVEAIVEPENNRSAEPLKRMTKLGLLEVSGGFTSSEPENSCSTELLKSMKKLRVLEVTGGFTSSEPTYFPEHLRWLSWYNYPFESLRITRDIAKLVGLQIIYGRIKELQIEEKVILPNLKFINLGYSYGIRVFPDVSGLPNLEWLNLSECGGLVEIHKSLFLHQKIVYLNLSACRSLEILPSCMKMKSLQTLLLDRCRRLKRFPEVSTDMERLSLLHIDNCYGIRELPSSIRLLIGLTTLNMSGCFELRSDREVATRILPDMIIQGSLHLSSLRILDLSCNHIDDTFPNNLHNAWPSLEEFLLNGNMFTRLPATISQLSHLKHLDLDDCMYLKELPELPSLIQVLRASGCRSLQKIRDLSHTYKWLFKISISGCPELLKDGASQSHIANMLTKSLVQKCAAVNHRLSITVPGSKIPNWFTNQRLGNKIELNFSHNQISKVIGLAICCVISSKESSYLKIRFESSNKGNLIGSPAESVGCSTWVGYMPIDILGNLCYDFVYENLIISFGCEYDDVVECGVCVVYRDDINPMTGAAGSWISDYDELNLIDPHNATTEELNHGRLSSPAFIFNPGDQNSVTVYM